MTILSPALRRLTLGLLLCLGGPAFSAPAECPPREDWADKALDRILTPPAGLPTLRFPEDNPPTRAKIELGRKLFFDRRLSINGTISCAMCHVPEQAFTNVELKTAVGVEGRSSKRSAPTLLNVGYLDLLFQDGRDIALETQFIGPIVAINEMANPSAGHVVAKLRALPDYPPLFQAAFGAPASLDRIGAALATYQRSLVAGRSAFDLWQDGSDPDAMPEAARRGFALFAGKAGCAECHTVDNGLFTDQQFHDTGYGRMREDQRQSSPLTLPIEVAPGVVHQVDFALVKSVSAPREADLGRYEVTEDPADRWAFRTPGLRNVAMTPPYMHDGYFGTLREVLTFYNQGGVRHPEQDPRIRPLGLTETEIDDIEAFLGSLTSPDLPCLAAEARVAPPDNF
ncbi:cytochrome-c peroxidase [Mameliella sediminis]|uniref:cytochrome-c peroxidase n=1 Tax=Mameliella sediminis TaxID=2836866 RepID=UPI001C47A7D0|nr:cytochrome c peroxidase [Mameliella sediminis]MBV7393216.1 c-type cytochrome [Mameliella sediminis]